jgi:hypothetical protein
MPNPPPNAYSPTSESGTQSPHKISLKSNGQISLRPTTLPVVSINAKKQSIGNKSLTTNKQINELRHISSIEFIDDESEVRQEMDDLKGKIDYCWSHMSDQLEVLQKCLAKEQLEQEDNAMIALAELKKVRDILKGTLKFSPNYSKNSVN